MANSAGLGLFVDFIHKFCGMNCFYLFVNFGD